MREKIRSTGVTVIQNSGLKHLIDILVIIVESGKEVRDRAVGILVRLPRPVRVLHRNLVPARDIPDTDVEEEEAAIPADILNHENIDVTVDTRVLQIPLREVDTADTLTVGHPHQDIIGTTADRIVTSDFFIKFLNLKRIFL